MSQIFHEKAHVDAMNQSVVSLFLHRRRLVLVPGNNLIADVRTPPYLIVTCLYMYTAA